MSLSYREKFFAYNNSPYICYFCLDVVDPEKLVVHHIDHDKTNNKLTNLSSAHVSCHRSHHATDQWTSERHREYMSGVMSRVNRSRVHTDEARAKMRAAHERRRSASQP
jgi:HNH endonuclease